jgi:hypothetical protein
MQALSLIYSFVDRYILAVYIGECCLNFSRVYHNLLTMGYLLCSLVMVTNGDAIFGINVLQLMMTSALVQWYNYNYN